MGILNLLTLTNASRKFLRSEDNAAYQLLSPDDKVAVALKEAVKRLRLSITAVTIICEQFESRGELNHKALEHEVAMMFATVLVFIQDVGLIPDKLLALIKREAKH